MRFLPLVMVISSSLMGCRDSQPSQCGDALTAIDSLREQDNRAGEKELAKTDARYGRKEWIASLIVQNNRLYDSLKQVLEQSCSNHSWSPEALACFKSNRPPFTECVRLLSGDGREQLALELQKLTERDQMERKSDRSPWNPNRDTACASVAQAIAAVLYPEENSSGAAAMRQRALLTECSKDWGSAERNCFGDANSKAAFDACMPYLKPNQAAALNAALATPLQ